MTDKAPPISEKEFMAQVIKLARMCQWKVAHFRSVQIIQGRWMTPVQADGAGFPDLLMVHPDGRMIAAELKRQKAPPMSPEQEMWIDLFAGVPGCRAFEWRPDDLDEIIEVLKMEGD